MTIPKIPEQPDLLHPLASVENCINAQSAILTAILKALSAPRSTSITNADVAALAAGQNVPYRVLKISMSNAGVNVPYNIIGGNFVAASDGSLAGVTLALGNPQNDALPLLFFVGQQVPVTTIYLSWPAQVGTTLYIAIGMAGVAFNASPSISDAQLAQLTALYTRWGRQVVPAWTFAAEASAPLAGATLVSQTVTAGKSGFIYGAFLETQEANDFLIMWTSGGAAKQKRITFSSAGAIEFVDPSPLNEGLPADASSTVTIVNVNAGGAGKIYQANLFYGEC
jgi:hypothetical protein